MALDYYYQSKEQRKVEEEAEKAEANFHKKLLLDKVPPRKNHDKTSVKENEEQSQTKRIQWRERWAQFKEKYGEKVVKAEKICSKTFSSEAESRRKERIRRDRMHTLFEKGEKLLQQPLDPKGFERAFDCFKEAADMGFSPSQYAVGECYRLGRGVEKSDEMALIYYRLAAEQGFEKALWNTADWYCQGRGAEPSYSLAVRYYKRLADQGHVMASQLVGNCYLHGSGVAQSNQKAAYYYKLGAQKGDVESLVLLANAYWHGRGVKQSIEKAIGLFELALDDVGDVGRESEISSSEIALDDLKEFIEGLDAITSDLSAIAFFLRDSKRGVRFLKLSNALQVYKELDERASGNGFLWLFKNSDLQNIVSVWKLFEKSRSLTYFDNLDEEVFFLLEEPWMVCQSGQRLPSGPLFSPKRIRRSHRLARQLELLELLESDASKQENNIGITLGGDHGQNKWAA